MSLFSKTPPNTPKMSGKFLLPVIHVLDLDQVLRNVGTAKINGADGVFLINHGSIETHELVEFYEEAVKCFPGFWIGLNCLDLQGYEVFRNVPNSVDGIWIDDGGISEKSSPCNKSNRCAKKICRYKEESGFTGKYFGGVAFKGRERVRDVKKVAEMAMEFMDVVTTSGTCTGVAADVEKIASMKEAIGDKPLALASGVTLANVFKYLPFVDYFLVATGISSGFYELDPQKLYNLAKFVHEY